MSLPAEPKPSTRFLKRYILPSDTHAFIGRIFDLSIVGMNFDSYEEVCKHDDCKYALDVNWWTTGLVRRVESLNSVGGMLWPEKRLASSENSAISRFDWLVISADAFLMRYISVYDCALILTNTVFEMGLEPRQCTFAKITKGGASVAVKTQLRNLSQGQHALRQERNERFHHGSEREFTDDDMTFKTAAMFESRGSGMKGRDINDRPINTNRYFKEGLVSLQRKFNPATRDLVRNLDYFYDSLLVGFENRFSTKYKGRTHKFGR